MHRAVFFLVLLVGLPVMAGGVRPAHGPFNPEMWPPTIDTSREVHFVCTDGALKPPSATWHDNMKVLTGGDQQTETVTVGGHTAVKVDMFKFNTADDLYPTWAKEHTIDILLEVFGDDALFNPDGSPRYFNFLTGTLPEPIAVDGGEIPREAKNGRWNWVLCRIPNGLRHMDGGRLVGAIHPRSHEKPEWDGVSRLSGQNGGTIRIDGLPGVKIRVVAFGQKGAFGEPDQINRFRK